MNAAFNIIIHSYMKMSKKCNIFTFSCFLNTFVELGQLIGTPEYMSPEQAEMTVQDIDTRTDVYSLGVLLYELLVGALPFDPKELREAGFDEIRRRIREEEPSKPSTRISTLDGLPAGRRRGAPSHRAAAAPERRWPGRTSQFRTPGG